MKRFLFLLSCLCIGLLVNAQTYKVDLDATLVKNFEKFKKGDKVKITSVVHDVIEAKSYSERFEDVYSIVIGKDTIPVNGKIGDRFNFRYDNVQDLWDEQIICNVLVSLQKKGTQNNLRNEMEEEALDYISKQKEYNMVLNDPYLENYIYSLISKIAPVDIVDGRPGNVNILIVDNPTLNAGMYSNGTMVIHTGLLSALHTEDELVAILSHEIAHFVLDHSVKM